MSAAARFCAGCGAALGPAIRFCEKCGRPVRPAQPEDRGAVPSATQTSRVGGIDRRVLVGGAAAAALVALIVVLFLWLGGDGKDEGGMQTSGSQVSAAGVTLTLPAGWAFLNNGERGLVLAESEADLTVPVPGGSRLTVEPGSTAAPDGDALVGAMAGEGATDAARLEVVEEPETVPVGTAEGVSIGLLEDGGGGAVVKRYVIVNVDGTRVYQFVLEAPESEWDSSVGTLETVLGSTEFEPETAAIEAPTAASAATAAASREPTSTPGAPGQEGFTTAEEAIYAAFGFEGSPIINCNSGEAGTSKPCYDLPTLESGSASGDPVYVFRPAYGEMYWVLVKERPDGSFYVADTVPMEGEFEYPNSPF